MDFQTIIELREQDEHAINNSIADYEIELSQPLKLENNDSLSMKGAFIDSVDSNSGRLFVPPDEKDGKTTFCSMTFYYYVFDWGVSGVGNPGDVREYFPNKNYPDGKHYIYSGRFNIPAGADWDIVNGLNITNDVSTNGRDDRTPTTIFSLQYTDLTDKVHDIFFECDNDGMKKIGAKFKDQGDGTFKMSNKTFEDNPALVVGGTRMLFPIICKRGTFTTNPAKKDFGLNEGSHTGAEWLKINFMGFLPPTVDEINSAGTNVFTPVPVVRGFTIPSGSYAPDELAKTMSKAITAESNNFYISNDFPVDNNLMQTTQQLKIVGDGVNTNTQPFFVREDGEFIMRQQNTVDDDFYVGTSQFSIEFNENIGAEGIFQITQMHSPLFSNTSANTIIKAIDSGVQNNPTSERVKFYANKNGGIVLTGVNDALHNILFNLMKFDSTTFFTTYTQNVVAKNLGAGFTECNTFTVKLVEGENITGNFKSIDVPVGKLGTTAGGIPAFDRVRTFPFDVEVPLNNVIFAKSSLTGAGVADSGYYLIEITSNFFTDIVGATESKKNIMGIVSRFYQQDSFTSSMDGEGGLTYIHKGLENLMLSSFRVRILNPDYTLATGLQQNNTIFLQITKSQ